MKLSPVPIGKVIPRLVVLTAFAACQQQLAQHGGDPRLLALGVGETLLGHLSGDFVIEWFRRSTDREFESLDHVIADAVGRICARESVKAGDVRARWRSLLKQHHAELEQISSKEIAPLLTGRKTVPYEEMLALAGELTRKSGPLAHFRRGTDAAGRERLARALCTYLPQEIKRLLNEDNAQQPWRQAVLDVATRTLRISQETHEKVVDLHPKVDEIGVGVEAVRGLLERRPIRSDPRERPLNLFGDIPWHTEDYVDVDGLQQRLHDAFRSEDPGRWRQALTGDGGLGKSCAALEYCYRFHAAYRCILWIGAADRAALDGGLVEIARHLGVLARGDAPTGKHLGQTLDWLAERKDYLLVLDGVEDFQAVDATFVKPIRGRMLVTTRLQDLTPVAQLRAVPMPEMDEQTGVEFLFQRTQRQPRDAAEREEAGRLVTALGACPLLLELAASDLWHPDRSFAACRADFAARRLAKFAEIEDGKLAAALTLYDRLLEGLTAGRALLDRVVFLAPESIADTVLTAMYSDPKRRPLAVDELVKASLLRRNSGDGSWSIHRLVQEAVRHRISPENRNAYLLEVIDRLESLLPPTTVDDWTRVEPILVHALVLADAVARYGLKSVKAGVLLHRTCLYLLRTERYPAAVPLLSRLNEQELALGLDAAALRNLVDLALTIETEEMARALNNLAYSYNAQGRYAEAEPLFERSLAIHEKVFGPIHPETALALNNLAGLYQAIGRLGEAGPLFEGALAIWDKALGPDHPLVASCLNNLATLYREQGRTREMERLCKRSLEIREKTLGPDHPKTAVCLNNLAVLYSELGRYEEAEPLYERALAIREKALGLDHPDTAISLNNLAALYAKQGRDAEATALIARSFAIPEKAPGPFHPYPARAPYRGIWPKP